MVPNTLIPSLGGLDWTAMRTMFKECLTPPTPASTLDFIPNELNSSEIAHPSVLDLTSLDLADTNSAMKNLIGDSAELEARKWADDGSMRQRLNVLRAWLGPREREVVDRVLGRMPSSRSEHGESALLSRNDSAQVTSKRVSKIPTKGYVEDSDDSSDDDGSDAHARTAHMLFAEDFGMQMSPKSWVESSLSPRSCGGAQVIGDESLDPVQEHAISTAIAEVDVQAQASGSSVQVPVFEQIDDTTLVPAIQLPVHHSLPTPISSPVLRPLVAKGKGKEREIQINAETTELLLPSSSPPALRSSLPISIPRVLDFSSEIHSCIYPAPPALTVLNEFGEDRSPTPALSVMSLNARTSPFASFEYIDMTEVEPPDDKSLKPHEIKIPIRICDLYDDQQSPESFLRTDFSQQSLDAPPSQQLRPFKSLSNRELSRHPSSSTSQSQGQSQQSNGHRRKRRRIEGTASVPDIENSDVVHAHSLVSALGRRKTEGFVIDSTVSDSAAYPRYRSRAPSPDTFRDVGHAVSLSRDHQQRRHALRPGSLAPNLSAPLLLSPHQPQDSNHFSRSHETHAISSTSALVTSKPPCTLAPAPTIPILSGPPPTSNFESSSKISRQTNHSPSLPSNSFASSSSILPPARPQITLLEKSSASRSEARRKQLEMAEKLCRARPDLVNPTYAARRARRLRAQSASERSASMVQDDTNKIGSSSSSNISADTHGAPWTMHRQESRSAPTSSCVPPVAAKRPRMLLDVDTGDVRRTMNWERSRGLARDVSGALAAGRKASDVLPRLMCTSTRRTG